MNKLIAFVAAGALACATAAFGQATKTPEPAKAPAAAPAAAPAPAPAAAAAPTAKAAAEPKAANSQQTKMADCNKQAGAQKGRFPHPRRTQDHKERFDPGGAHAP